MKDDPQLNHLPLFRQSRLSVMPIDAACWTYICTLGGV
ncbi:EVE domain-containing protein [Vibrio parahaemolyticus]